MKPKKWSIQQVNFKKTKISDQRHEQLLAEVGEVLYKRLCQQVSPVTETNLSSSTEPSLTGLDKDKIFTQTLKKGS